MTILKIIDVSEHNGKIDWERVKPQVDGVIIRCGFGSDKPGNDDKRWQYNVSECERLGIPFGVYLYSYAKDTNAAKKEAEHVLRMVKGHRLAFPIYFDAEQSGTERFAHTTAATFCPLIEAAGYRVGIYSTAAWFRNYIGLPQYTRWVASWGTNDGRPQKRPNVENMGMWQFTSVGKIDGVNGNVDVSMCYLKIEESEDDDMTDERVREIVHEILDGKDTNPDDWAKAEIREAIDLGITDGTRPKGYATRQEAAIMVLRAFKGGAAKAVKDAALALIEKIKEVL